MSGLRMIVHKFDPATPAPGGIDTCIRGILKYWDRDEELFVAGVDGGGRPGRALGVVERHSLGGVEFDFLPVAHLDPGNQIRRVPHALVIARGLFAHRSRLPKADVDQTHRADLGFLLQRMRPRSRHDYFIHTQESGILGKESDSFWKRAASVHRAIERSVVRGADRVRVFNPSYAEIVKRWNPGTEASPTWWDPALVQVARRTRSDAFELLWVGRFEQPKVPSLAVETLARLVAEHPNDPWRLTIVGAGNLADEVRAQVAALELGDRVRFAGRLAPPEVMREMADASVLLMTSVDGYEGFPRVLVEGLANGLRAVVTSGSDTGGLVRDGVNGFRTGADAGELARAAVAARQLDPDASTASVEHLAAPAVIADLYRDRGEP